MPSPNSPDIPEQERQQHFGKYGFQPLTVAHPGDVPAGIILSEQVGVNVPPMGHLQNRHLDVETTDAHMLMRAKRKPTDWRGMSWFFDGNRPIQLLGIRVGRETALFFNGSSDVLFARTENDCRATSNENFVLKLNNTLALDTEGEFWANAPNNTTLNMIETWYDLASIELAQRKIDHRRIELNRYGDMQSSTHERKVN